MLGACFWQCEPEPHLLMMGSRQRMTAQPVPQSKLTSILWEQGRKGALLQKTTRILLLLEGLHFPVVDAVMVPWLLLAMLQGGSEKAHTGHEPWPTLPYTQHTSSIEFYRVVNSLYQPVLPFPSRAAPSCPQRCLRASPPPTRPTSELSSLQQAVELLSQYFVSNLVMHVIGVLRVHRLHASSHSPMRTTVGAGAATSIHRSPSRSPMVITILSL